MWLIIYQKDENGHTFHHLLKYAPRYTVGDYTNFGWFVVAIYYFYDCSFLSYNTFLKKRSSARIKRIRKSKLYRIYEILREK